MDTTVPPNTLRGPRKEGRSQWPRGIDKKNLSRMFDASGMVAPVAASRVARIVCGSPVLAVSRGVVASLP